MTAPELAKLREAIRLMTQDDDDYDGAMRILCALAKLPAMPNYPIPQMSTEELEPLLLKNNPFEPGEPSNG